MTATERDTPGATSEPRDSVTASERELMARSLGQLDPVALGIATGAVAGSVLALATAALLVQGGSLVGFHLKRLGHFLPGYTVSWPGVGIGWIDAAVAGFVLGASLAWLWNTYHRLFVGVVIARERAREVRRELQEL